MTMPKTRLSTHLANMAVELNFIARGVRARTIIIDAESELCIVALLDAVGDVVKTAYAVDGHPLRAHPSDSDVGA